MTSPAQTDTTLEEDLAAAVEAVNAKVDDTPPVEEAPTSDGPARGPDGKFAPKEPPAEDEGQKGQIEANNTSEPELSASPEPVIPDRFALPPQYAKKGIRDKWAELPAEVRQELHERESDFHKQLTRNDEERNFGKQVKQVVAPYEPFIRSLGADPVQAVDYLIKTDYALRTAPPEQRKALLIKAAADYGVNLNDHDLSMAAPSPADPRVETLQQRLERLESERNRDIRERQLAEQRSIEQQIADFSSRPENAFFDRVSPMMATLLQSGQADSLEKAYEMAVYADPETRALQLAAQAEQSQRSTALEKQAQAQKARAASVSVTGAPGLTAPASSPTSSGSLEEDIRAAIAATSRI